MKDLYRDSIDNFYKRAFKSKKHYLCCKLLRNQSYLRYRLYYCYCMYKKNINKRFKKAFWYSKYSNLSIKLNVMINGDGDFFLESFYFEHFNVVINQKAVIGKGLLCVGNNCIGSNDDGAPTIGNNVVLGYGAIVLGNISIADNCIIGAGAIITKSITEPGSTWISTNKRIK